jgi:DHA3 family macrolide efflux protein-like MFS transporter
MSSTHTGARLHWRRDVALLLTGQTISMFGSMLVQFSVMWYLTLSTKSGVVLALSVIFGMLPQAFVAIFGGVWADRLNRKVLIVAADSAIAVSTLVLAFAMLSGVEPLWLIFLTLAIRSAGAGIQMPASASLLPQLVPRSHLLRVNGIFGSVHTSMALLGPAVAGVLYATWSIVPIFFIDAITAMIGIGFLLVIRVPRVRETVDTTYFGDLIEGVRYVVTHRLIRWIIGTFTLVFLIAVAPTFLTPLMLAREFGEEVWKLTVLEVMFSIGMVGGNILIATWASSKNRVVLMLISGALFGGLTIGLGLSPNLWVLFGFMLAFGIAFPFFTTPATTLLQEQVEPRKLGRVFGFFGVVMALATPAGMAVFGPVGDLISVQALLVIAGATTFIGLAVAFLIPSGRNAIRSGRPPSTMSDPPTAPITIALHQPHLPPTPPGAPPD